jgi:hypothetical protein
MNFLVFVMTALAAPAIGWWMQKLAGGATLTLDVFDTAGSVYVAAIVIAAILTLFLKETGSAQRALSLSMAKPSGRRNETRWTRHRPLPVTPSTGWPRNTRSARGFTHIHGTSVPVEEPSTASEADIGKRWPTSLP